MAPIARGKAARSRNTTPMSTPSVEPAISTAAPANTANMSYAEVVELCRSTSTPNSVILQTIVDVMKTRSSIAKSRSSHHDMSFRDATKRKAKELEKQHELELARSKEEDELKAKSRAKSQSPEVQSAEVDEDVKMEDAPRPPAVGARGVARQDGLPPQAEDVPLEREDPAAAPNATNDDVDMPAAPDAESDAAEDTLRQPRPAPAQPHYQTFGPDPSKFDDPTIYHIRDPNEASSEEEKREILGVSVYPEKDLFDQTCGVAPDRNLENAKPAAQTSANAFAQYLEPYFRKFTDEDENWLKERGDRMTPMIMPVRGQKTYRELWAIEDNEFFDDRSKPPGPPPSTNQPRGSIEQMSEDLTETNDVSISPMLARLLQCMIPERRAEPQATTQAGATVNGDGPTTNGNDGDVAMTDIGQVPADDQLQSSQKTLPRRDALPPATSLPEMATSNRGSVNRPSAAEMDELVKRELRYIGFLSEDAEPEYDGHFDDPIAARLRFLQEEFHKTSIMNGARKARLTDMVAEARGDEEYAEVVFDQETQINQAYSKRHRNTGKGKGKLKRAGAAAGYDGAANGGPANGLGVARPSMGTGIRTLLHRRKEMMESLGPLMNFGRLEVPKESVFNEEVMRDYIIKEKEAWVESQEALLS